MQSLTELQQEAMGELFNIAYGVATSLISDSIGMHSTMYVPQMQVISMDQFYDYVKVNLESDNDHYLVSQVFLNYIEGETVMLMSKNAAKALTDCYSKLDDMLNSEEESDIKSCTMEISNIITSALIGRIADLTNTEIFFQPPEINNYDSSKLEELNKNSDFTKVIVIKIIIDIDNTEIKGTLFVLLKTESYERFKKAIDYFIDHYAS